MKKILCVALCVCMLLSMQTWVIGVQGASLGHSGQATRPGQGIVSDNAPSTMKVGGSFQIYFDSNSINWSTGTGTGTGYQYGQINANWVIIDPSAVHAFKCTGINLNPSNGTVTATIEATGAFNGTLKVWMDSGAGKTKEFSKVITVTEEISKILNTKDDGTAPSCTTHSGAVALKPGDQITWSFNADNFAWDPASGVKNAPLLTDTGWIKLKGATIGTDFTAQYSTPTGNSGEVRVTLTALKAQTYSSLQICLQGGGGSATKYSPAMNVTVTSDSGKINGIADSARLGGTGSGAYLNSKSISYSDLESLEVSNGDELLLPLYAGFFTWDGTAPYASSIVTASQVRNSNANIKVTASNRKGAAAFRDDKPELIQQDGRAYIRVRFSEDNTSTKDIDFSWTIYFSVNGKRHSDSQLQIGGTLVKEVYEVDSDNEYIDLSDGLVIEVSNYVRNMELYLGNGVTMFANLTSGKKYAGVAKLSISSADERLMDEYSAIEHVIVIENTNLSSSNNKVTFDMDEIYHVYNKDHEYLGRSNEKLPYSSKYYLSSSKIDFRDSGTAVEEVPPSPPAGETPPRESPPNRNDNPGTGR